MKRIFLWAVLVLPSWAMASPPPNPPGPENSNASAAPFGTASRVAGNDLAAITGRADVAVAIRADNTSTVSHNSVSGVSQTGAIAFDARAFANLSGLSLLSANTGNNVSINSSLNLNVAIQR